MRLSSLLALQALLKASRAAFVVQNDLDRRLTAQLSNSGEPDDTAGFDALFVAGFDTFTSEEADDQRAIRGYTEHAFAPSMSECPPGCETTPSTGATSLHVDKATTRPKKRPTPARDSPRACLPLTRTYFCGTRSTRYGSPIGPRMRLVYLDDEKKQGLGFTERVEADVRAVIDTESRRPFNLGGASSQLPPKAGSSAQG